MFSLSDLEDSTFWVKCKNEEGDYEFYLKRSIEKPAISFGIGDLYVYRGIFGCCQMKVQNPVTVMHKLLMSQYTKIDEIEVLLDEGVKHTLHNPKLQDDQRGGQDVSPS